MNLRPQMPATSTLIDAAALVVLGAVAAMAYAPVFGNHQGLLAAILGLIIGAAISAFTGWRRWRWSVTAGLVVVAYLLLGGPVALPTTCVAGIVPTLKTGTMLAFLTVQSWKDLLTVIPPASASVGPAVMPWVTGLTFGALVHSVAFKSRKPLLGGLLLLAMLVIGILWGIKETPLAIAQGVIAVTVLLGWSSWKLTSTRLDTEDVLIERDDNGAAKRAHTRQIAVGAAVLAVAVAGGTVAAGSVVKGSRYVLRQDVKPPLGLRNYPSPLTHYRYIAKDLKETELFTVSGLPVGERLRMATVDGYDGTVYNVAAESAGFLPVSPGAKTPKFDTPGETRQLTVTTKEYNSTWLPIAGDVKKVSVQQSADDLDENLYYNPSTAGLFTPRRTTPGVQYTVDYVPPATAAGQPPASTTLSSVRMPTNQNVPETVVSTATEFAGEASTAFEQIEAIQKKLQQDGYYSDGSKVPTRPGHSAERMSSMLGAQQLIGDDEQYAVAMTLMLRQLGIPARVVMGFYQDPKNAKAGGGPVTFTGNDAHVWTEVPFQNAGWVAFDPAPDRDKTPTIQEPKPKPKPRPQVLQPPDPPVEPIEPEAEFNEDSERKDKPTNAESKKWIPIVAYTTGGSILLLAPFVAILLAKFRRRKRRRLNKNPHDRAFGAWQEITDTAVDLKTEIPWHMTRREVAKNLENNFPGMNINGVVNKVDSTLYGGTDLTSADSNQLWQEADIARKTMLKTVSPWRRSKALLSLNSYARSRDLRRKSKRGEVLTHTNVMVHSQNTIVPDQAKPNETNR